VKNLQREAKNRDVDPDRIVFAPYLASNDEHLARNALADLFLDTLPCNAHTSASDALWAGVPVLTLEGTTFAGRVAASMLRAVGLDELIAHSAAEYESLAVGFASDTRALEEMKQKLRRNRDTHPLFDTAAYTRDLERAFERMTERQRGGLRPEAFAVESPR
jgi:protein O-GlcNAc transferase